MVMNGLNLLTTRSALCDLRHLSIKRQPTRPGIVRQREARDLYRRLLTLQSITLNSQCDVLVRNRALAAGAITEGF